MYLCTVRLVYVCMYVYVCIPIHRALKHVRNVCAQSYLRIYTNVLCVYVCVCMYVCIYIDMIFFVYSFNLISYESYLLHFNNKHSYCAIVDKNGLEAMEIDNHNHNNSNDNDNDGDGDGRAMKKMKTSAMPEPARLDEVALIARKFCRDKRWGNNEP